VDLLWSPWRYDYIKADKPEDSALGTCIFCGLLSNSATDEEKFILHRAEFNFVILNIYPYISGHIMIVPFQHISDLDFAAKNATDELMDLTKQCQLALRTVYEPDGINLGMNFGKAAGAGVADHYHLHILPRWVGDSNFMTATGQTRTIPESLHTTFKKLKPQFK
jgi:ATP adenylyltransferase